ncbi:MAG: PAS domain S-box protein [Deltaproteobacteria bacterium]|nr:PAS domain S-box protein [Deltaproteobacteria bacterium]
MITQKPIQSIILGGSPEEEMRWFMFLRIFLVGLLLIITMIYQVNRGDMPGVRETLLSLYSLMALTFAVDLAAAFFLPRIKNLQAFSVGQVSYDILFVTLLLYATDVIAGGFNFLYLMVIIFSALVFSRKGALLTSFGASAAYTILLLIQPSTYDFFYHAFVTSAAFIVVGLLSGYLTEQLRQTGSKLIETQRDVHRLADLNRAIIENVETGIITTDVRGRITFLNAAGERLTGIELPAVRGEHLSEIFPEFQEVVDLHLQHRRQGIEGSVKRLEHRYKNPEGKRFRLGFAVSILRDDQGKEDGRILIFEDLTQIAEMERKLRLADKLAAIGQLAAGMAHEIRNPLASMSGSIEMLKSKVPLDSDEARLMNIVMRETERLNLLLTEFLEFVKPTKSKEVLFSLRELIQETIVAIKLNPEITSDVEFVVDESFAPGYSIEGDPDKIKQVFWNLFLNACQAMPYGGKIEIFATAGKEILTIGVRDTGMGMNEEVVGRIFDPFYTTKERGTGLGLSTSYRIIEAHQGGIHVESQEGKGTTFYVSLPLAEKDLAIRGEKNEAKNLSR